MWRLTSFINPHTSLPHLPKPLCLWGDEMSELAIALDNVVEVDISAFMDVCEWKGGVEVADGSIDDAEVGEGV